MPARSLSVTKKSSSCTRTPDIVAPDGCETLTVTSVRVGSPPRPVRRTGNSIRCCTSTGAGTRVASPARSPVTEWHVVQRPSPSKYAFPAVAFPLTMSPTVKAGRSTQRVVDPLPKEVHQLHGLRLRQVRTRAATLHRMTFLEKRTEQAAVAIVEHDDRPKQTGRGVRATCGRAMARDAFDTVERPAPGRPPPRLPEADQADRPAAVARWRRGRLRRHGRPGGRTGSARRQ